MTDTQRTTAAPRYDIVWGACTPIAGSNIPCTPQSWTAGHPNIGNSAYTIIEQSTSAYPLSYFQTNHPDWILYNCAADGTPTTIPAYMQAGSYGTNAPIDMHNPDAVNFMIRTVAVPAARAAGYNALALDQVVFSNIMGGNAGTGSYGCGVYQNGSFVRRYTSSGDPTFASDVVNWVRTAKNIVTADNDGLQIFVNHPAGSIANSNEQTLLANVDAAMSENGFVYYGNYPNVTNGFANALRYMSYVQGLGHTAMVIDKFVQSMPLTANQREYVVATYLMANNGRALLYSTYGGYGSGGYGTEHYLSEYATNLGAPCGDYAQSGDIFIRRFFNGAVAVNNSITTSGIAQLPNLTYSDIEGRPVGTPLVVAPADAYVLTTTPGTGCGTAPSSLRRVVR